MTDLAYMVREDWARHGTAMVPQSAVIRDWLGDALYLFAVADAKKFKTDRPADLETAEFIAPDASTRKVFNISEFAGLTRDGKKLDHAVTVLHPYKDGDIEALREAVQDEAAGKVFVMIWSPRDVVRTWLDGLGGLNLHAGSAPISPDPLMVAAATSMVNEEDNGLSSGHGKDAVVQLVRAFAAEGYPVEVDLWLRAYFAAGGTFRPAESISKLIGEMKKGVKHREHNLYGTNIVAVLRERVAKDAAKE